MKIITEVKFYRFKWKLSFPNTMPGKYLNGLTYRPSHIHYKSSYLNQNEITTII